MNGSRIHFLWKDPSAVKGFRTGISLHGHTLHSQECLSFLPRYLHQVPGLSQAARRHEKPGPDGRPGVDFARAYWTPPLTPADALSVEQRQIEKLGLQPIVSLTDHDGIEAPMALQVTAGDHEIPISVEWTVPYAGSIFHIGVHNLPAADARASMAAMQAYTTAPDESALPGLLEDFARISEALIVLNHPFWLEEGVAEDVHKRALDRILPACLPSIHAFELNATRPWWENGATIALAQSSAKPLISGGDRHACEPSAAINLTSAQSFSEFADEIRSGHSTLLFMPQYQEPLGLRILEAGWDILRPYPEYPGRARWTDRFFYFGDDGIAKPLSAIWEGGAPWELNWFTGVLQLLAAHPLRGAMRMILANRGEVMP